jgi:hypothetical protein
VVAVDGGSISGWYIRKLHQSGRLFDESSLFETGWQRFNLGSDGRFSFGTVYYGYEQVRIYNAAGETIHFTWDDSLKEKEIHYIPNGRKNVTLKVQTAPTFFVQQASPLSGLMVTPQVLLDNAPTSWGEEFYDGMLYNRISIQGSCTAWQVSISKGQDWLGPLSQFSGSGQRDVSFDVTKNTKRTAREGAITVKGCSKTVTIPVIQAGKATLSLSPSSLKVPALGGVYTFNTKTNQPHSNATVATDSATPAWIRIWIPVLERLNYSNLPQDPSGTALSVRLEQNTGPARSFKMTIEAGSAKKTVTITQEAGTLKLSSASWSPAAKGASRSFVVTTNLGNWTAQTDSNAPWLTISGLGSGASRARLALSAAPNTGPARTATVTVTAGDKTVLFTVKQAAPRR